MVLLRQLLGDVLRRLRLRQGRTLREVSDNFALAELQQEPVLGMPREPGLRVPAEAGPGLPSAEFVSISTIDPDTEVAMDFADSGPGFDVTDMVPVSV
jgi:hypothetical protein